MEEMKRAAEQVTSKRSLCDEVTEAAYVRQRCKGIIHKHVESSLGQSQQNWSHDEKVLFIIDERLFSFVIETD